MGSLVLTAAILMVSILYFLVFGRGRFTKNLRISFYILARRITEFIKRSSRQKESGKRNRS